MTRSQGNDCGAPSLAAGHAVDRMCALAGVSRASYYRDWAGTSPGREETALRDRLQQLALSHRFYGYRRITALLRREGWAVNRKRVARMMREDNLLCLKRSPFKPATTDSRHDWRVWPNLARRLIPMQVNQLWVADITYVHLDEAFVYLAVIFDAFSRKVVGWYRRHFMKSKNSPPILLSQRPATPVRATLSRNPSAPITRVSVSRVGFPSWLSAR